MLKIHDMPSSADNKDRIKEIQAELRQLELQRQSLLLELGHISEPDIEETTGFLGEQAFYEVTETPEEKIQLFLRLFRCRRDVFPRYWENERSGKAGYSPVCANEWCCVARPETRAVAGGVTRSVVNSTDGGMQADIEL